MNAGKTPLFSSPFERISGDLNDVEDVGNEVSDLNELGLRSDYRETVWKAVQGWYRTGTQPFVSLCIRRRGELTVNRSIGHSHGTWSINGMASDAQVGSVDTPVGVFSASKALTALLIHGLAEENLIDLDQRVAHYLPEFACNGKQSITVSQVLSHQAGIPVMPKHMPPETLFDYDQVVDVLMRGPIQRTVGRGTAYHAVSGGYILGAVASKVTGQSLNQILRKRIAVPLGLESMHYGATLNNQHRVATNYNTGRPLRWPLSQLVETALGADWNTVIDLSNRKEFLSTIVPAGNAVGTANEWSTLMEILLNDGRVGEVKLFKSDTIKRATAFKAGSLIDGTLRVPSRFSEGFMLGSNPLSLFGPMTGQAFGHLGFINVFCWADPARELSVALLSTGKSLLGTHLAELARALWAINRVDRQRR
ncbi:MAG: serine hydrolase domain-containing protein [Gammaproteobacteria bacterium]